MHYSVLRKRREREKGKNVIEVIVAENCPEETDIYVQEAQIFPNTINPRRATPRHIVIKMAKIKDKERILKAVREKHQVTYKGMSIGLSANFSAEILQARKEWHVLFKVMKGKNLHPRIL